MEDDSGRQAGWYGVGGALVAAGCALFSLGLTAAPRSQTLQFLGLTAFVAGLAIVICAMTGRQRLNPAGLKDPGKRTAAEIENSENSENTRRGYPRSQIATVAVSVIVIGAGAFGIFGQGHSRAAKGAASPMLSDEHMVSLLIPGDNYARLQQIIGPQPDLQQTFKSGDTLYQFNRQWEYIDLLVSHGRTLSVAVYAKTTAFKATLDASGYSVTVNGSTIAQQADASAIGAVGNCGGNIGASFFEGFALPMANEQASFALGWIQSRWLNIPQAACSAEFPVNRCDKLDSFAGLSLGFLDCLNESKIGEGVGDLRPSVAIVTAPGQSILPEMLDYGPLTIGAGL